METKYLSYTQNVGWFASVREAQKYIDNNKEKGVTFAVRVLPNSFGVEVYKTTVITHA
jgi:hypothetical protein